jgi:hypothetical protein
LPDKWPEFYGSYRVFCYQEEHPDRPLVSVALDSMRSVAYLVNESKRRAEMQQHLVNWQRGVEHWQVTTARWPSFE